ncbi:hypothetical protein O3P69_013929 [Scylla paramamosain]|uniref:Uncharacterized protein n=1 Tax=Scylla paramamosain TaxID=85552 RepID=A0AAW0STP7_SCYPA
MFVNVYKLLGIVLDSATQILQEAERSLYNAVCVLAQTVQQTRPVHGGASTFTPLSVSYLSLYLSPFPHPLSPPLTLSPPFPHPHPHLRSRHVGRGAALDALHCRVLI